MAIDFTGLNTETLDDPYPMPTEQTVMAYLSGAKYFTSLDMVQGYHQVLMDRDSRMYTAFGTGTAQYQFKVMPFGLKNAPAVFVRFIDEILGDLKGEVAFMDDILIYSKTYDEHLALVDAVLKRMIQYKVHLKASKCEFAKDTISYIGHVFTRDV